MATAQELRDDLKYDADRLPLADPDAHASADALAVLEAMADHESVACVAAYARGAAGGRVGTGALLGTLQRAAGQLALVTWGSTGINAIGYRPAEQRFDVGGFSAIQQRMGNPAEYYESTTRAGAKGQLAWSHPDVVCRDEADLLPALEGEQ